MPQSKKNQSRRAAELPTTPRRWANGVPRSQHNAFTGHGYTDDERARAALSRTQVLNGHVPHKAGVIPWNGPYTEREQKAK